ncbi:MAG: hypothetical protein JO334_06320 [Verrucomicrobia bacterium]|nr:hypothetical protein [Verrucomicrobiota bacterium]
MNLYSSCAAEQGVLFADAADSLAAGLIGAITNHQYSHRQVDKAMAYSRAPPFVARKREDLSGDQTRTNVL